MMVTDVLYAFSSSSSLEESVTRCDCHLSGNPLPPQLRDCTFLGPIRRWVIHSMLYPTTYVLSLQRNNLLTILIVQDINGGWSKLGSGSFGNVYKGARRCYETP